jgi:hypothetical protein
MKRGQMADRIIGLYRVFQDQEVFLQRRGTIVPNSMFSTSDVVKSA